MIARFLVCLAALFYPESISAACTVRQRAVVPLEIANAVVVAPVMVNGMPGRFILDTGASDTVVSPDAVSHFNLALDEWTATTLRGVGGIERRRNANPRSFELGGIALRRRSLLGDTTLRVATLPRTEMGGRPIDGLLGRDLISAFDLDLDFPRRTLTLFDVAGCDGRFLPWTETYFSVPVENPAEHALLVPVELDGVPLRALLDTGATRTLVAAPGMARLALGLERLQGDPSQVVAGLGPHTVTMWQHKFRDLRIGGETFGAPEFLVAPIQLQPISDMLLGEDWLMDRRIWISYATKQMFSTK